VSLSSLWRASPSLSMVSGFTAAVIVPATLVAFVVDPRSVAGAPAWLKPLKFAISTAVYAGSIAWLISYLPLTARLRRAGTTIALMLMIELALIDLQASRGIPSHFNVSTPFNIIVVLTMGVSISALIAASVVILKTLWPFRFADAAMGYAIRGSLAITIVGTLATGALMTAPRGDQLRQLRHGAPSTLGSHSVGGRGDDAVLPMIGWNAAHGDLRPAHFVALHALQFIPLLLWALTRRVDPADPRRLRLSGAITWSYGLLVIVLIAQALAGAPIIGPLGAGELFTLCTCVAASGWLLLIAAPRTVDAVRVADRIIPVALAIVYTALLCFHSEHAPGGFRTLAAVGQLFANPWLLLAGWIHYLAFDLLVGGWMVRHWHGRGRLLLTACLLLTFLFGPLGLLLYLVGGRRA
jgi:hypothetical protein